MPTTKVQDELLRGAGLSIINLIDGLIEEAYALRASDIHINPTETGVRVRFRIDGVLQDRYLFPKSIQSEVVSRIKILAGLRTDEHQAAQDGRFRSATKEAAPIDIRASIVPTYYGESTALRLLADRAKEFSLETLGFGKANAQKILDAIRKPHGMILSTGPTGSGKTTTLYTLIKRLNTSDISILTIEDPIEYAVDNIKQIQVNSRSGLGFASGLRSILRQDPNIIMVGEIRDAETASIAVNTALTGHLLLSTLHTNDAATSVPRLLDMGIEAYLVASTLNLVIGQRLIRKICLQCKKERKMKDKERTSLIEILSAEILGNHKTFYRGAGCDACAGSGYRGRTGIGEVLIVEDKIREAIVQKASRNEIRRMAIKNGMTSMLEAGFQKALSGETTVEEVLRVIHE